MLPTLIVPYLPQEAAQRFVDNYEALLRRIAADPAASLPGFEPHPVNCISLSALRCVLCSFLYCDEKPLKPCDKQRMALHRQCDAVSDPPRVGRNQMTCLW